VALSCLPAIPSGSRQGRYHADLVNLHQQNYPSGEDGRFPSHHNWRRLTFVCSPRRYPAARFLLMDWVTSVKTRTMSGQKVPRCRWSESERRHLCGSHIVRPGKCYVLTTRPATSSYILILSGGADPSSKETVDRLATKCRQRRRHINDYPDLKIICGPFRLRRQELTLIEINYDDWFTD
jgi:hypothetical protein